MDKKIISENTYTDTFFRIMEILRGRTVEAGTRHILFVPDKYTLYAEQQLYKGTAGAFDAEVLTLNRLFFRICGGGDNYLSKQGAVMLTRRLVAEQAERLTCFARSAQFSGFAEKLYETMAQLAACRVRADDLPEAEGALGRKLADIQLLYKQYEQVTQGRYVDSGGRLELLLQALETTDYFADTVVYFADFDAMTEQTARITERICARAKAAYVGLPTFENAPIGAVELYEASDETAELKAAARRIRDAAYHGMPYGDMVVAMANPVYERVRRIFTEFGIPFYIDKKLVLGEHPLSQYCRLLLQACERLSRADVTALAKNHYSGIAPDDADVFENYCNRFLVDYLGFSQPFTRGLPQEENRPSDMRAAERVHTAERVRQKLYGELAQVQSAYRSVHSASAFARLLRSILERCDAKARTETLGQAAGCDWGDCTERLLSAADVLMSVFGEAYTLRETLTDAYFEGLDATEFSLLPNLSNTVSVGDPSAFRGTRCKKLFVLGFTEGNMPQVSTDCGLITDREIDVLHGAGVVVEPKISQVNERARQEILSLLASADEVLVGFPSGGDNRLSSLFLSAVRPAAKRFVYTNATIERELLRHGDSERVAAFVSGEGNAAELLALGIRAQEEGDPPPFMAELYAALGAKAERLVPRLCESHPDLAGARDFFFGGGSTTISRIQEYFACPYKHFLKYGLRLKEREDGRLSPLDIGNFLHKVIELFVARGRFDDIDAQIGEIVRLTADSDDKYRLADNDALVRQISAEAAQIARVVAAQITGGRFVPLGQEMRFGGQDVPLKTLRFDAHGRTVSLTGIIDRVDCLDSYARVIDYKTGQVHFDFPDLYYGRKIQLMLYMRVMMENGYRPAGMFYFPFSVSWGDDALSHRLLGVYNDDPDLLQGMDIRLADCGVKSEIIAATTNKKPDKDGKPVLRGPKTYAFTTRELEAFGDYAYAVLREGADEILSGCIAPAPYRSGRCECDFCEVRAVCNFDAAKQAVRERRSVKADYILSCVLPSSKSEGGAQL